MHDVRIATLRAIHDALSIRGITAASGGFMRTASPESYMDAERLRIAKEVAGQLPADATHDNAFLFVERMAGLVMRLAKPDETGDDLRLLT